MCHSVGNKVYQQLHHENKNGRYSWGTLIFSSTSVYVYKILIRAVKLNRLTD